VNEKSKKSLDEILKDLYPKLIRYVRSKVSEQEEAHEIVQASFEVLAAKRDGVENPRPFVFKVASNKIKQYYEHRSRGIVSTIMALDEVPMATLSTRLSIRVARENDLAVAMQKLTRRQYQAFELRYVEGFEIAAVADMLEVSPATIKRDVERAREILASVLGNETDEAELSRIIRAYLRE
jgi:RNA polymerase sigma factor (sigma-70 family)